MPRLAEAGLREALDDFERPETLALLLLIASCVGILLAADLCWHWRARRRLSRRIRQERPTLNTRSKAP